MNCEFVQKNLTDIVEREFPPEMQKQIDAHLSSCHRCASLVERFAQIWQGWEQPVRIEPSPAFWTKLQRRIRESERKKFAILPLLGAWAWERWLRPIAAVATLLIGVLAGYHLGNIPVRNGAEQFFEYHLGSLDDFPTGSVGEFYVSLGQNN
jgi:predicted anti-sigma-YlaC factor YlaD